MNKKTKTRQEVWVLLVDRDPAGLSGLADVRPGNRHIQLVHAAGVDQAKSEMKRRRFDLAVIDTQTDGPERSFAFALALSRRRQPVRTLMISTHEDAEYARLSLEVGADGYLSKDTLGSEALTLQIEHALVRSRRDQAMEQRLQRLRKLCRTLSDDQLETAAQVETLCNDLVTAYQELSVQVQDLTDAKISPDASMLDGAMDDLSAELPALPESGTAGLKAMLQGELDLEVVLRRTLEWSTREAGPTNAAIFLPCSMDEYSLGGYVNYDVPAGSADMLLQHLADVLAPKTAEHVEPLHLTTNAAITDWIGDDAAYLADSEVIALAAHAGDECLAVLVLFRDGDEPFDANLKQTFAEASNVLGTSLENIIQVHHRHLPDDQDGDGEDQWGTDAWTPQDDTTLGYVDDDDEGGSLAA